MMGVMPTRNTPHVPSNCLDSYLPVLDYPNLDSRWRPRTSALTRSTVLEGANSFELEMQD